MVFLGRGGGTDAGEGFEEGGHALFGYVGVGHAEEGVGADADGEVDDVDEGARGW